jgi:chemotaxis protein methyltransferase CheR
MAFVKDMAEEITIKDMREVVLLINTQYGYDFSGYSEASLLRRVSRFCDIAEVSIPDLKFHLINDKSFFSWMLQSLTVNVTEMFRDPLFYKQIREDVLPVLDTYPIIKIWHAGCASGEEVFSMAILLYEAGLLGRSKIYATDINMQNIEKAKSGIIPLSRMKEYTVNYRLTGGKADFSNYYSARYDHAIFSKELRSNILFSQHNLVTDYIFNEFQLIFCRNVLIYFNKELQNRVINLFYQSLSPLGYLALGIKESLLFTDCKDNFEVINSKNKIFRLQQ